MPVEQKIIEAIKEYIGQKGICCADGLVENFYLSLKSRPFTFLLGSGDTDMARLPRLLAEAVGATAENGRYMQLQVRPDWMDSSDLFGWVNLEGRFIPGAIIDFLKAAHLDPDKPYFLCLDHIILSRAEYYLRNFLDAVASRGQETPKPYVPTIYYGRDEGAIEKYGQIPALDNLYIVGTVNLDETSLPLNQRLLDRVHTLRILPEDMVGQETGLAAPVDADNRFLRTQYFRLDQCPDKGLLEKAFAIFDQINKILLSATSYVGFQIRNDGILYLAHNRQTRVLPEQDALDYVILQRVLPRVQGNKALIQPVLEDLLAYCTDAGYERTVRQIRKMLCQCEEQGYASCWG